MKLIDVDNIEINEECTFSGKEIKAFLNAIPIAYKVDSVMEQLWQLHKTEKLLSQRECKIGLFNSADTHSTKQSAYFDSLKIVMSGFSEGR